jgi:pimeloyl-ACP methyl ester carboxylesterase
VHPDLEAWRAKGRSFDYLGWEVFYIIEGSGPCLLLVHGYPFSSFDWVKLWPELTARFTVVAPDMLGLGFSDKPDRYDYTVQGHADMHEALLAHLGIQRCRMIGHDIGVSVIQEMLARGERHERPGGCGIESITWLNGGLFYEVYRPRPIQTLLSTTPLGGLLAGHSGRRPAVQRVVRAVRRRALAELFGPDTRPSAQEFQRFDQIMDYKDGVRVIHQVGRFIVDRLHHRDRWVAAMRTTKVPMRLINGPFDPNSGRHMAERYRQLIPDADVVLLGEAIGHWPQLEDPAGVLHHFLAFNARVDALA